MECRPSPFNRRANERGRTGRVKGKDRRVLPSCRLKQRSAGCKRYLIIDHRIVGMNTGCVQFPGNIAAHMVPTQPQQGLGRAKIQQVAHQCSAIRRHKGNFATGALNRTGAALTNHIGRAPSKHAAMAHTIGRGDDQTAIIRQIPVTMDRIDSHDRRYDCLDRRIQSLLAAPQKPLGSGVRTDQQQGGRFGHFTRRDCVDRPAVIPRKRTRMQRGKMQDTLTILGLESSCDDTAAAIVRVRPDGRGEILASVVASQTDLHADFGGVVPEIAARAHVEKLDLCAEQALAESALKLDDIDAIAVTAGPGLIGGVMAGVMFAKGLAAGAGLPLIGVNHLAGHALTPRLTDNAAYPYLMLLVSGGHCQFLVANGPEDFTRLGGTIDDAPGEAFDKAARLMGLPQPGGPAIEACAREGDAHRFHLPRPLLDRPGCDMSFSGLKTALLRTRDALVAEHGGLRKGDRADLAASFQVAIADVLAEKSRRALARYLALNPANPLFAVAGGVAANQSLRAALETVSTEAGASFLAPPLALCTDNAAMIAWAGGERFRAGQRDDMRLSARPRWPLDQNAPAMLGSGKKGAKA